MNNRSIKQLSMRIAVLVVALLVFCFCVTESAQAQVSTNAFTQRYLLSRPTVSPYLNLLRGNNNGNSIGSAGNYQTLVRPLVEQREFARIQQAEINRVQQQVDVQRVTLQGSGQRPSQRVFSTGHRTHFLNYGNYYPGMNSVGRR